jgi:hypothetical protein
MRKSFLSIILLLLIILNNSCTLRPIHLTCGISETAQIGINHLQPFVDAMEKYKADNGRYPAKPWEDLIPKYIDKIPILNCTVSDAGMLPIHKVLENKKICESLGALEKDGSYFRFAFTTTDDRICLLGGRNNICEYSSDRPFWNCHQ